MFPFQPQDAFAIQHNQRRRQRGQRPPSGAPPSVAGGALCRRPGPQDWRGRGRGELLVSHVPCSGVPGPMRWRAACGLRRDACPAQAPQDLRAGGLPAGPREPRAVLRRRGPLPHRPPCFADLGHGCSAGCPLGLGVWDWPPLLCLTTSKSLNLLV